MDHLLQLLKTNPSFGIPTGSVAQAGSTPSANSSFSPFAPWIIDSSTSDHMTSLSHLFITYSPYPINKKFKIADGSMSPITGKGSIKISKKIELKFVLHVPKFSCNLLSISKLSRDSNCRVIFL
ncbi:hypothetical protein PanWU01x14_111810 [Parasponia andersonii]|uniref:Retrovirus-related Pol polyprotein from transposon TNT 1-94-like beta-barrel domain-containing protein n=1 Tax=Parasponia andersonii TaxID=3476 RepID=A0A2P5CYK7_PARAD|nr:hypothetical protein PanWU01x14_111810 [Parasponia andersonii]